MSNLKEVKGRIALVSSTEQITRAMKMVSAAKLRKAQARVWQLRPYMQGLEGILAGLLPLPEAEQPLLEAATKPDAPLLLVPISSDKGLCGGFNNAVIKAALARIAERRAETHLLPLGRRVNDYFQRHGKHVHAEYHDVFPHFQYARVEQIAQYLITQYLEGHVSSVVLIYNEAKNVATQRLCVRTFLPFALPPTETPVTLPDYIYEPSQAEILDTLLPLFLRTLLYQALSESNAAEHGARMTAMDKASENASQLLKDLKLTYNRTRQAVITREIMEIVSGAEALQHA